MLTHKLLWGGALTLPHVAGNSLYDSWSFKGYQRHVVLHQDLWILTLIHWRGYTEPKVHIRITCWHEETKQDTVDLVKAKLYKDPQDFDDDYQQFI